MYFGWGVPPWCLAIPGPRLHAGPCPLKTSCVPQGASSRPLPLSEASPLEDCWGEAPCSDPEFLQWAEHLPGCKPPVRVDPPRRLEPQWPYFTELNLREAG